MALNREQLLQLARHGAAVRIAELQNEISVIKKAFPNVSTRSRSRRKTRSRRQVAGARQPKAVAANESRSTRRGWTAAQRKAAAARMKAYWRKRKAHKKQ